MLKQDLPRFRSCEPSGAPPGWCLRCVARCQGRVGQVFDRPRHAYTSIEFVEAGSGTLTVRGETRKLVAGDAFILPEGEPHRIVCGESHPWRVLFIDCNGPLPGQLMAAYGLTDAIYPRTCIAQPLRNLLQFAGPDAELQIRAGLAMHEIMAILQRSIRTVPPWPALVVQAKIFIDAHLESPLRMPDIARHVGCSEAHLSRLFRQHLGSPPGDYIITQRMELAKALLYSSGESVKAIAARLGFRDAFAFSHAFKKAIGSSPSAWRSERDLAEGAVSGQPAGSAGR